MNPLFNQKYKTTLCRHWQQSGSCSIGVRCVFAHGQIELRNPNDPITLNQNILSDPKMLTSFMTSPLGDVTQINAMVTAQKLQALKQQTMHLQNALRNNDDKDSYKNTFNTAKEYVNKQHFDLMQDPTVSKNIQTAQFKYMTKQLLKMELHPILKCKVQICKELLDADNINAAAVILDQILERPSATQNEKAHYEYIIDQAGNLSMQILAEQKMKYQKMQKDQQTLLRRQMERVQQSKGF